MPKKRPRTTGPDNPRTRRNVYLTQEEIDWLNRQSARTGDSASHIIRDLIRCQRIADTALELVGPKT